MFPVFMSMLETISAYLFFQLCDTFIKSLYNCLLNDFTSSSIHDLIDCIAWSTSSLNDVDNWSSRSLNNLLRSVLRDEPWTVSGGLLGTLAVHCIRPY